jgi:hypothetical protein
MGRKVEVITPPRVATNGETDINKALIDLSKLVDSLGETLVSSDAGLQAQITAAALGVTILSKGYKVGGNISWSGVNNQHTMRKQALAVWYSGKPYLVEVPETTLSGSYANYPAIGSWAYVTVTYQGVVQLRPATGAATVRPSDNFYQLTGGSVGYDDIGRYGYYYADGERIVGAFHRVGNPTFYYITNGPESAEDGENANGSWYRDPWGGQTCRVTISADRTTAANINVGTYGWSGFTLAANAAWTYPVPFLVSQPSVSSSGGVASLTGFGFTPISSVGLSSCAYQMFGASSVAGNAAGIIAVGRYR